MATHDGRVASANHRRSAPRSQLGASGWFVLAGAGAIVLFYVSRVVAGRAAQGLVYNIVSAVAVIAILVAVRLYQPARPLPWLLLAAGQSLYAVADFVYWYLNEIRHFGEFPTI